MVLRHYNAWGDGLPRKNCSFGEWDDEVFEAMMVGDPLEGRYAVALITTLSVNGLFICF